MNSDRWNEILETITSNWLRTLLTAFGVFWGIFILIILLSAGRGLENGIRSDFGDIATNTMFIWTQKITKAYQGMPKDRNFNYKLSDVEALRQNIPNLRFISPRNQLNGFNGTNNVVKGLKTGAYNIYGDYPEFIQQEPMQIIDGRFINYGDITEKRKVAVIGEGVVSGLYEQGEAVLGSYIKIQGVNFMVIGVYKKRASGGDSEEQQKQIFIPFTSFSQAFNMGDKVGWMAITSKDGQAITDVKEQIVSLLKANHKIHPEDERAIGYFDLFEQFNRVENLFTALRIIAYFVGILVLLSGVIGVSNIMLIVVKERTKEIGIRRALGATPWEIRGQILTESLFITLIAGMGGIIMGAAAIYLVNYILGTMDPIDMFMNPSVNLKVVLIALSILVISGLLAGFIPAQNAIRVKPVDALRTE
jgi:putative ABC transport system permease protein